VNSRYDGGRIAQLIRALINAGARGGDVAGHHFDHLGCTAGASGAGLLRRGRQGTWRKFPIQGRFRRFRDHRRRLLAVGLPLPRNQPVGPWPLGVFLGRGKARLVLRQWPSLHSQAAHRPCGRVDAHRGIRHAVAGIEFDLSAEYYYYPAETPAPGSGTTNYWQSGLSASRRIFDAFEIVGRATYAPNSWNSGAWGAYGSGEIKIDLPKFKLPNRNEVTWALGVEFGHQSFGTTSQGSALPSYAHWRLGAAFKYDVVSFDLSYHDTHLSKEACFVLAGDSATPGVGRFGDNPGGLQSNLCGRALVATLSFEFKPPRS
jgi:hypothetical protein